MTLAKDSRRCHGHGRSLSLSWKLEDTLKPYISVLAQMVSSSLQRKDDTVAIWGWLPNIAKCAVWYHTSYLRCKRTFMLMACKGARCDYYPGGQWWTSFPPSQLAPSWVTQFSPEKLLTLIGLFSKYDWLSVIFTPVHCAKKIERGEQNRPVTRRNW